MARRIIPIKSVRHGNLLFRAGLHYALDDEIAQELVETRVAYYEGDDPPYAETDLAEFALETSLGADAAFEAALRLSAREEAKFVAEQKREQYVADKRARRAALAHGRGKHGE